MSDPEDADEKTGSRALVSRQVAAENQKFSVFFDELALPGEGKTNYLVVAAKQVRDDFVTGVAVLPVCEGKIGLLRIYRHAIQEDSWEIPRGFVEENESSIESASRELTEETGLSCNLGEFKPLGFVTPDAGILAARVQVYAALRCVTARVFKPAEFGHQQFCWFDTATIREKVLQSEIQDPCTIAAYYRFSALLNPAAVD
jgi:ADP-ribose pyrophosphatase YjhB (NUDIX family)